MSLKSFAHLLGLKPRSEEGDSDEEKSKKAKSKAKGKRAEEDEDKDPDAEEDDDRDPDAEEDDEDSDPDAEEDDDDKPSGKKAKGKKAEDEDDDADAKVAKGRRIERKRCAAIFGSKAAGVRPDMAASLAFGTGLSASAAISQLEQAAAFSAPQGGRMSLDQRMQSVEKHRLAPDAKNPAPTGANAKVTSMLSLYNAATGQK